MFSLINKILIISAISLAALIGNNLVPGEANIDDYIGESIQYIIKPGGKVEYTNLGIVDFKGAQASLITLKSKILFVEVEEKIFSDPETLLPYRTERVISGLWSKEYRTEEYDQKKFTVVARRVKGEKLIKELMVQGDGPINNMNLLLFYLRKQPELKTGRHFTTKVFDGLKVSEVNLELISIDGLTLPSGKFQAYHFKSIPAKFELWMNKNSPQVPLQLKIKGIINCTVSMEKYSTQ